MNTRWWATSRFMTHHRVQRYNKTPKEPNHSFVLTLSSCLWTILWTILALTIHSWGCFLLHLEQSLLIRCLDGSKFTFLTHYFYKRMRVDIFHLGIVKTITTHLLGLLNELLYSLSCHNVLPSISRFSTRFPIFCINSIILYYQPLGH